MRNASYSLLRVIQIPESDELNQTRELCPLRVGREQLAAAQKSDQSLRDCVDAAVDLIEMLKASVAFLGGQWYFNASVEV